MCYNRKQKWSAIRLTTFKEVNKIQCWQGNREKWHPHNTLVRMVIGTTLWKGNLATCIKNFENVYTMSFFAFFPSPFSLFLHLLFNSLPRIEGYACGWECNRMRGSLRSYIETWAVVGKPHIAVRHRDWRMIMKLQRHRGQQDWQPRTRSNGKGNGNRRDKIAFVVGGWALSK